LSPSRKDDEIRGPDESGIEPLQIARAFRANAIGDGLRAVIRAHVQRQVATSSRLSRRAQDTQSIAASHNEAPFGGESLEARRCNRQLEP
jgi:hypothetical protein